MRVFRPLICIFVFLKCVNYFAEIGVCSDSSSRPGNDSSTNQPSSKSSKEPIDLSALATKYDIKQVNDKGLEVYVEGSETPNDPEKCKKKEIGGTRTDYEFEKGAKCIKVVVNGAELWNHGDFNYTKDPESVSLTNDRKLTIFFDSENIDYSRNNEGYWSAGFASMGILKGYDPTSAPKKSNEDSSQTGGGGRDPSSGDGRSTTTDPNGTSGSGTTPDPNESSEGDGSGEGTDGSQARTGSGTPKTSGGGDQAGHTGTGTTPDGSSTPPDNQESGKGEDGTDDSDPDFGFELDDSEDGSTKPADQNPMTGRGSPLTSHTSGSITPDSQGSTTPKSSGSSAMTGGHGGPNLTSNPGHTTTTNPPSGSGQTNNTEIALDIKKNKKPTPKFSHEKSGKVVTYTAKDDYKFTSVIYNGKTTIWSADNAHIFSKMVVLDGRGKKDKTVTIHLANGSKKVFKKDKNNPWHEVIETNPNVVSGVMAAVN